MIGRIPEANPKCRTYVILISVISLYPTPLGVATHARNITRQDLVATAGNLFRTLAPAEPRLCKIIRCSGGAIQSTARTITRVYVTTLGGTLTILA